MLIWGSCLILSRLRVGLLVPLKFFGQPDDGLYTGPKHVVVSYILLLIVILLCSWLYVYIDTHYSCVLLAVLLNLNDAKVRTFFKWLLNSTLLHFWSICRDLKKKIFTVICSHSVARLPLRTAVNCPCKSAMKNKDETGRQWFRIVLLVCVCIADIFYFGTAALKAVTSLRFCQTKKKNRVFYVFCFWNAFWRRLGPCSLSLTYRNQHEVGDTQVCTLNSWRMKAQLDVTCYFISLLMLSACFGH